MSDLMICKFRRIMVIHDTECPYWDHVSLNNTNQTKPNLHTEYLLCLSSLCWEVYLGGGDWVPLSLDYFTVVLNIITVLSVAYSIHIYDFTGVYYHVSGHRSLTVYIRRRHEESYYNTAEYVKVENGRHCNRGWCIWNCWGKTHMGSVY